MLNKATQTRLGLYFNEEISLLTSYEFVDRIDLNDLFQGIILPPAGNKLSLKKATLKIIILSLVKGMKYRTILNYLNNNPHELKKLNITTLPKYDTIRLYSKYQLGEEVLKELNSRINDLKHDNKLLIRDNQKDHIPEKRKNKKRINKEAMKEVIKGVQKFLLEHIRENNSFTNKHYSDKRIIKTMLDLAVEGNDSANSFTENNRENEEGDYSREIIPVEKTLRKRMLDLFSEEEDIIEYQFSILKRAIKLLKIRHPEWFSRKRFNLAIDEVSIPTWEKTRNANHPDPMSIVQDAHYDQKGTTYFREYLAASITISGFQFMISIIPITQLTKSNIHKQMEKLLLKAIKIIPLNIILLDKAFETKAVLECISAMKLKYLIPAKITKKVKMLASKNDENEISIPRLIRQTRIGNLLIKKSMNEKGEEKILAFNSNISLREKSIDKIFKIYKERWQIETSFAGLKRFKAITTSRNSTLRTILMTNSVIVFNLWILTNITIIILFLKTIPKKPTITKNQFSKIILNTKEIP